MDDVVPIHVEALLPAFVLGCLLERPEGHDPHRDDARPGPQEGPEAPSEQRVSTILSAIFMVLIGLSLPPISFGGDAGAGILLLHALLLTAIASLGKMFPLLCYRSEALWLERLATCISMWPRGEVGAGVLLVTIGYGLDPGIIAAAAISLAMNLLGTGLFIFWVKSLLRSAQKGTPDGGAAPG